MRVKGVHVRALVGMVIGATLFGWSDADAVLCVKSKKGVIAKVTIRDDACKKRESIGDPSVLLGLPTTTSPTTTTTLAPSRRASRILDSAGNQVAWVTISPLGNTANGVWALRVIDDRAIIFPMNSNGPIWDAIGVAPAGVDDFQNNFAHQGTECTGDRYAPSFNVLDAIIGNDLISVAHPNTDGKTGYVITWDTTTISAGFYSGEFLNYQCAKPGDPAFPPTVTCSDDDPPKPPVVAVAPVGSAFPCDANKLGGDPTTECMCIRCCATSVVAPPAPPVSLFRVKTVDLGLGNSTPPYRVEP